MKKFLFVLLVFCIKELHAQPATHAQKWADSVLQSLTPTQRIAQLMVVRLSSIDAQTRTPVFYDTLVNRLIQQYNIGGVCLFQGGPVKQAQMINALQKLAQTPVLVCIDGEWGVGMRLTDTVMNLPRQMMLGAVQDSTIVYEYGKLVAAQCKRLGIHVNYAPTIDVNNNPNNPVINDRSFGEDKYVVARYGIQYSKGMQDNGVMACAKHFPGHGDVATDSHYDLPVINKTMAQLDSLELYPFRQLFAAGVGSAMVAHLFIPAIDSTANRATSVSKNNVTGLLRNTLGYQGLTFTDALEMQGVKKFYPNGEAAVQSLIAGNDMLCLPGDVPAAINKIQEAIAKGLLTNADIDARCKKVLLAKYQYIGEKATPVNTLNIAADLNTGIAALKKRIAEHALTVLSYNNDVAVKGDIAYVAIGLNSAGNFGQRLKNNHQAAAYFFNYKQDSAAAERMIKQLNNKYSRIVIGIHAYSRTPANNYGISKAAAMLVQRLTDKNKSICFVFGNPYAIKNFCTAPNLVACYDDDAITQTAAADWLEGRFVAKGKLPVTVCEKYQYGAGLANASLALSPAPALQAGLDVSKLSKIDSIAHAAIQNGATPGCMVLVVKDGKLAWHRAYGHFDYNRKEAVTPSAVYDMASVTKTCATTLAIMKLYEQGKIHLDSTLGSYLPITQRTDKAGLSIRNILLHQAGLVAYIPFYKETIDSLTGLPIPGWYSNTPSDSFNTLVAEKMYLKTGWTDTFMQRILQSPLPHKGKYVYSDNDFIFLGKVVEAVSGMPLQRYVEKEFYRPMALGTASFLPLKRIPQKQVAPTEKEPGFRQQLLRGHVHDPGAALFGGVAGHAGLFSNAYDIAAIMQMLMNGGNYNGKRYLKESTIQLFTGYGSGISRRGLGFDKPEKDNNSRPEPYPCKAASPLTFGHTGFTGTCAWADPAHQLVFVFLSNRVSPQGDNTKLLKMNIRPQIHEAIYDAIIK